MAVRAQPELDTLPSLQDSGISLRQCDRGTFCISNGGHELVLHKEDASFSQELERFYTSSESSALEKLLHYKSTLRRVKGEAFWGRATEALADLTGAQYAFISRRMDVDEENAPLPALGDPGSCLMGMSILYVDAEGKKDFWTNSKYLAYKSPCAHMKYNKVFLVPERMTSVCPDNENQLPEAPDGYLAVPLSYVAPGQGPSFGHFGVMWTQKGLDSRQLSFALLEMLLHGLEDLILQAFEDQGLTMPVQLLVPTERPVLTVMKDRVSDSFKPFARSLSHELRTPMQGVVGMLDIMYATVQEANEGQVDVRTRQSLAALRENIEVVQDSARRAVEAADNIVHAYDMNMSVPEMSDRHPEEESSQPRVKTLLSPVSALSPTRGHKRTRSAMEMSSEGPSKFARVGADRASGTPRNDLVHESSTSTPQTEGTPTNLMEHNIAPGVRQMNVRDAVESLVNDMIRVGGRPESAIGQPIESGEEIEVRRRGPDGSEHIRLVKWTVDDAVPETIMVDERDFAGLVSRVLHNAFKFTEEGYIYVHMRLSPRGKYILINIRDSGTGIPAAFMPNLFKPFSKEDDGITRQSEGLGLGLMVAKGLARRLNGDLYAVKSETDGPGKGTEFEMRVPLTPTEVISRPGTPFSSPSPASNLRSTEGSTERRLGLTPPMATEGFHRRGRSLSHASPLTPRFPHASSHTLQPQAVQGDQSLPTPTSDSHLPYSQYASAAVTPTMLQTTPCNVPLPSIPPIPPKVMLASRLPLSFLVVEDNLLLRRILVQMLTKMGYSCIVEAYDGAEAIRQMETHQRKLAVGEVNFEIDVVLMDLWMPSLNGYETAKRILDGSVNPVGLGGTPWKRPVIMAVTADVTDGAMERVASSGMRGPLTKPYKQADLERKLLEFCSPSPSLLTTNLI